MNRSRSPWLRAAHLIGIANTNLVSTLSSPTYVFNGGGSKTSYTRWETIESPDAPTKRVVRSKARQRIAWWISVMPTSTDWETELASVTIGNRTFYKPDHSHCVHFDFGTTNTDVGTPPSTTEVTVKYPSGHVVENPVWESYNSSSVLIYRRTGAADGTIDCYIASGTATTNLFRTQDGFWSTPALDDDWILIGEPPYGEYPEAIVFGSVTKAESSGILSPLWPCVPFVSHGLDYVDANQDWMPPIALTKVGATDVECNCYALIAHLDHLPATVVDPPTFMPATSSSDETGGDPLIDFFTRADLLAVEDGLYRPVETFLNEWVAVAGSDTTGYTPPTEPPTCQFVVKQGTI